jgi:hypothetical protein
LLKVNHPPYLAVIDLYGDVNFSDAEVRIDASTKRINVTLAKTIVGPWVQAKSTDAPEILKLRREAAAAEKQQYDEHVRFVCIPLPFPLTPHKGYFPVYCATPLLPLFRY